MIEPADFTDTTPRHKLPFLFAGQAQKEFTVNEALARIDLLLHVAVAAEVNEPPANSEPGTCYLVGGMPTGPFANHTAEIAGWDGQQWTFARPNPGMRVKDLSSGQICFFEGGWQRLDGPAEPTGGTTVDSEAREAIIDLCVILRTYGLFS